MKLTKKEFIERSIKGDRFILDDESVEYYYDDTYIEPFRYGESKMVRAWTNINGENEFTLVEPEQKMVSVAQYRVWNNGGWLVPDTLYETLEDCKNEFCTPNYKSHHEVEYTRVELPDYR